MTSSRALVISAIGIAMLLVPGTLLLLERCFDVDFFPQAQWVRDIMFVVAVCGEVITIVAYIYETSTD